MLASTHPPLTGRPVPPLPADLRSEHPASGKPDDPRFRVNLAAYGSWSSGRLDTSTPWYTTRPHIVSRLSVVHTNGASVEASTQSQINWGNSAANNTHPHWAVNDGVATRFVPSDRRAIGNSTPNEYEGGVPDSSYWSLVIETRDSGYLADPGISDFLGDDAELVAQLLAYESLIRGREYDIVIPWDWTAPNGGVVTHTWPHSDKYTTVAGKICPGDKKKATFRDVIVPRAQQIRTGWAAALAGTLPPPEVPDMTPTTTIIVKHPGDPRVFAATFTHITGDQRDAMTGNGALRSDTMPAAMLATIDESVT